MTDESDQTFPYTIDQLLNKALGSEGYYGVFCANMHTDADRSDGSDAIIASAMARNVPVISSKQLLTWLDGRNGSYFSSMSWNGSELSFSVNVASGARSLEGMLPVTETTGQLVGLTVNGKSVSYRIEIIKGIEYAFFSCSTGNYVATYEVETLPNQVPTIAITSPTSSATFEAPGSININASASDPDGTVSKVEFYNGATKLGEDLTSPYTFTWSGVAAGEYQLIAKATDDKGATTTSAAVSVTVSAVCPCTVFKASDAPSGSLNNDGQALQLGMKFRSSTNGNVTGVRFYKQSGNTGTHTGQLYSSSGTLLASVVFANETSSGWQQASFASPVAITAGTTYVITYHSSGGYYSADDNGFSQAISNGPLTGLANGTDGGNGVYRYTSSLAFPTSNYASSNYWVDVVFNHEATPANQEPAVSLTSPANNATFTAPATVSLAATASDPDGTVTKVEFYQGTTKLGEDLTSPYTFAWNNVGAGTYQLTARAIDNNGALATSSVINITVSPANQSPAVSITSPTNNASFTAPASVTIEASASDPDGTVSRVEFFNGATKLGEDLTSPYTYTWSNVGAGSYPLTARATDNSGAVTTSPVVNVNVSSPVNTPPTVAITSPANNTTFTAPATVTMNATASDADGTVSKVEFYNGGTKLGEDLTSPYTYTWDNVASGSYTLTARATDNLGATSTSSIINITVSSANQAPVVAITSPANNSSFTAPATISISATASDADGSIDKVEFFNGTTKLGEDLTIPYEYSWIGVGAGTYQLTARATDNQGAVTTSELVNVTVTGSAAPVINSFAPTSGPAGTVVTILGTALTGARSVVFGPTEGQILSNTATEIKAVVPPVKGKLPRAVNISVTTAAGTATATGKFNITSGTLTTNTVSTLQQIDTKTNNVLEVYPNPISGKATIAFILKSTGEYNLEIYDMKGVLIQFIKRGYAKDGVWQEVEINGEKLAKGHYMVILKTKSGSVTKQLLVNSF